jgi:hypothetical protein
MNPARCRLTLREQRAYSRCWKSAGGDCVRLTGSLLMVPTKTVSGLIFPRSFASCQLCPQKIVRKTSAYDKVCTPQISRDCKPREACLRNQ